MIPICDAAGVTGALLSNGTTHLLADRTMASAIGNASRHALTRGMQSQSAGLGGLHWTITVHQPSTMQCSIVTVCTEMLIVLETELLTDGQPALVVCILSCKIIVCRCFVRLKQPQCTATSRCSATLKSHIAILHCNLMHCTTTGHCSLHGRKEGIGCCMSTMHRKQMPADCTTMHRISNI